MKYHFLPRVKSEGHVAFASICSEAVAAETDAVNFRARDIRVVRSNCNEEVTELFGGRRDGETNCGRKSADEKVDFFLQNKPLRFVDAGRGFGRVVAA